MMPMGDYLDEHSCWRPIDDAAVEALLAGDEVAPDLAPLTDVVRALRDVAGRNSVPPCPALAGRVGSGRPRAGAGPTTLGLVAKVVVLAVAVAIVGTSSAGVAGVLPDPVQQRFETVIERVTPWWDRPAGSHGLGTRPDHEAAAPPAGERAGGAVALGPGTGQVDPGPFGQQVREQIRGADVDAEPAGGPATGTPAAAQSKAGGPPQAGSGTGPPTGTGPQAGTGAAGTPAAGRPGNGPPANSGPPDAVRNPGAPAPAGR
jgi:hypothetical protein